MKGVMEDVAASPNDPIFINHHAMIDCIFEEWLKINSQSADPQTYPSNSEIRSGHKAEDYIVPIIPLYKHEQMFKTADNFGYSCNLSMINVTNTPNPTDKPDTPNPTDKPAPEPGSSAAVKVYFMWLVAMLSASIVGNL